MHILPTILALVACGSPEPPVSPGDDSPPDLPSTYEYDPGETEVETVDLDQVAQAVDEVIEGFFSLNATPVFDAYGTALETADPGCPDWYEQDGNVFWYSYCYSDAGTWFDGYGFTYTYEDTDLFEDGNSWDADIISGSATITQASGSRFHFGGYAYLATGWSDAWTAKLYYTAVVGGFQWDAPEASGSWIESGASPNWAAYAIDSETYGRYLYASGSASIEGEAASAVDLPELALVAEGFGSPCELEPMGSIAIRSPEGSWVDIAYDIDPETWAMTGDCDGCGAVWQGNDYLGDVCNDFSTLLSWGDAPW